MDSTTKRQLLNVRVIRTSFRVAAETHPSQLAAAVGRALDLLADARAGATSPEVIDDIAVARSEVEAASRTESSRTEYRREG